MATPRAPAFRAWLDDFFASYYRHRPVNATFIGVHTYDDRLPDYSDDGVGDAAADMEALLARLRALPPEPLTEAEALDRRLAEGFLRIQLRELASDHFHRGNPCVYTGEAAFGIISLLLRPFAPLRERIASVRARLDRVPRLLRQGQAAVRRAPAAWIDRAVRECVGARILLEDGLERFMQEHRITDFGLRGAAATAAGACAEFQRYLERELRPHATSRYACGAEDFEVLMREGHCLAWDAGAFTAEAEERMEACEAYLRAHAAACGARTWRDALASLADRHPTPTQYYARHAELWAAARAAAEAHRLLTWPDYPIRYGPQPAWARAAAPYLYFLPYRSPAPYDRAALVEYLVTPVEPGMPAEEQTRRLRAANDSVIKLNHVIHHGGIGHHVQNWYAFRAASRIGQVAAVDCASRIAMFFGGTMAEGWACYATEPMDEIGFLEPLERDALCHHRLRMAARAWVDVKLHYGAITLDAATALYRDRVGMSPEAARGEAVKNSMFPGTAMMYLAGTDAIRELRRELSLREGSAFALRGFHDRLLSFGSIPVALIGAAMRREPARVSGGEARQTQGEGASDGGQIRA